MLLAYSLFVVQVQVWTDESDIFGEQFQYTRWPVGRHMVKILVYKCEVATGVKQEMMSAMLWGKSLQGIVTMRGFSLIATIICCLLLEHFSKLVLQS